jgi:hypothetical protein
MLLKNKRQNRLVFLTRRFFYAFFERFLLIKDEFYDWFMEQKNLLRHFALSGGFFAPIVPLFVAIG